MNNAAIPPKAAKMPCCAFCSTAPAVTAGGLGVTTVVLDTGTGASDAEVGTATGVVSAGVSAAVVCSVGGAVGAAPPPMVLTLLVASHCSRVSPFGQHLSPSMQYWSWSQCPMNVRRMHRNDVR